MRDVEEGGGGAEEKEGGGGRRSVMSNGRTGIDKISLLVLWPTCPSVKD